MRPLCKLFPPVISSVSGGPLHNFDKFQCGGRTAVTADLNLDEARFPLQIDAYIHKY